MCLSLGGLFGFLDTQGSTKSNDPPSFPVNLGASALRAAQGRWLEWRRFHCSPLEMSRGSVQADFSLETRSASRLASQGLPVPLMYFEARRTSNTTRHPSTGARDCTQYVKRMRNL